MFNKDSVVVYWAPYTSPAPTLQTKVSLMWGPPMPLLTLLETGSYRKCSAATSFLKNTFTFLHPKTATISYQSKDNNLTFNSILFNSLNFLISSFFCNNFIYQFSFC